MPQTTKISKNNTRVYKDAEGYTNVTLYNTTVVRFNESTIILNSDGWQTSTTRNRMNQTSNQMELGYNVYSNKGKWQVIYQGRKLIDYKDNMIIARV